MQCFYGSPNKINKWNVTQQWYSNMQIKQLGILIGEWGEDLLKINTIQKYQTIKCEEIISINFSKFRCMIFSFVALFSDKSITKLSITDKLTKSCA